MRRDKDRDCTACFQFDCDCECATCTKARKEREAGTRTPRKDFIKNLAEAIATRDNNAKP